MPELEADVAVALRNVATAQIGQTVECLKGELGAGQHVVGRELDATVGLGVVVGLVHPSYLIERYVRGRRYGALQGGVAQVSLDYFQLLYLKQVGADQLDGHEEKQQRPAYAET